ncbi:hypothetical protein RUM44_002777 [Polyplax serrata]|uniref:Uncharacterized protein n=1 Tax=Polyplax serrata TaxID=468196 RepID=A0ABR1AFQ3_POLSC
MVACYPFKEEKMRDKDIARHMAKWLIKAVQNNDLAVCNLSTHKRNSEIINSILGLPKNLNDAGRK